MSDTDDTTTAPSPADMPATTPAPNDEPNELHDLERARQLRSENKTLRGRAKDAEAERDTLRGRVEAMQRSEITRVAGDFLTDPDDIFHSGASIADFLDDDGNVDPAMVMNSSTDLIGEHPHWAKGYAGHKPPSNRPVESLKSGADAPYWKPAAPSWSDVIGRPGDRRI